MPNSLVQWFHFLSHYLIHYFALIPCMVIMGVMTRREIPANRGFRSNLMGGCFNFIVTCSILYLDDPLGREALEFVPPAIFGLTIYLSGLFTTDRRLFALMLAPLALSPFPLFFPIESLFILSILTGGKLVFNN